MSAVADSAESQPQWTARRARRLLVVLHISAAATPLATAFSGVEGRPTSPVVAVLSAFGIGWLQLRHSLAAARGERPRGWRWTGLALVALVYLPMLLPMVWLTWNWASTQMFVVASALMLLRGRLAIVAAALPVVGTPIAAAWVVAVLEHGPPAVAAFYAVYWLVPLVLFGLSLYGAARLLGVLEELDTTRAELAEMAVGQERQRVSRDLHDLLGQSLSAVALKGEVAMRLLRSDPPAARAEIKDLTELAQGALHGVRAVTHDNHAVSLPAEVSGAAALLSAAGIHAQIQVDVPGLSRPVEHLFAWAVRESVTNVLRHSDANDCSIIAGRHDGQVRLTVINDGARPPAGSGRGLTGLRERAAALRGTVVSGADGHDRFRLLVEVPEQATAGRRPEEAT